MSVERLIGQLRRYGFGLAYQDGQPSVKPTKPGATMPDELMVELKAKRAEVIEWFERKLRPPDPPEPTKQAGPPNAEEGIEYATYDQTSHPLYDESHDANFKLMIEWNRKVSEKARRGLDATQPAPAGKKSRPRKSVDANRRRDGKDDVAPRENVADEVGGSGLFSGDE